MISAQKIKKAFIAIAMIAYLPLNAGAWGMTGHRIVGQIADYYLTAKTRKAVMQVLGSESPAMASNWPDFIKSDSTYNYLSSWHYVNLPGALDQNGVFNFLDADKKASVYNKIPEMIAILKNKAKTADEKKMAMRLLIHMLGDVHQPMHTARKEDLGGNKVNVTWFGQRSNLHRVWDEGLVDYQQLSYTEYAAAINHPTKEQLIKWRHDSLKETVYESYVACNKIYELTKADDKLGYRYNFEFVDLLNEQLLKGGVRLAQILNNIYA
ncbi:S1/P1 nuclease [Pedobacter hartonius]|uniref:S1/P1 Nuclease n=1 Tax=Pedobacter hartonius TaxID=425514 RepID=A0A1H3ZPP1_9SPHI|nr:S1/P1 nuclease [Pedobacter hartonius]SEA25222.1 S1/P1 Nuclease [Pedobacter hartonius]